MVNLEGKVALITGGTRGIGLGIAEAFLAAGASVAINGRSPEKGAATLHGLSAGDRAWYVGGDVKVQADVEAMVDGVVAHFGGLDILVNNAGGSSGFAPIHELSDSAWQEAGAWILDSCFWATRRALPAMLAKGWGRIINISSVEGSGANKKNVSHYITFKHAMNGFTKATAFEYGDQGITVNAISPGAIETDLMIESGPAAAETMGITYEAFKETYAAESAIKRLNTVEEVASLALFLTGDLAGGITGGILPVDGGTGL
ncbi:MAG: SDR family oxidoreductase [Pseudomonadales bacterium]|jgi:3-hydroxybutyrate dehydrogenase|nr:SDR family oxidoreductase [Pseudomonadales bacterium]MDA0760645.1 SDR family NAD(P)-dependent oxidoreductase [Pseudomonadota bacterium]MDA0956773.1 SDR family NAD(P)-dependent oxidoreductase [Pseudomonadota bacterium]MDA1206143.1 SDR family NAD(P)-dependent oxidoreductase [Pseudomonadota bacterium]